jgi:hypothetical protein
MMHSNAVLDAGCCKLLISLSYRTGMLLQLQHQRQLCYASCRHIPYQFRVLVFASLLVALSGLLIGLPMYGSLAAARFGETSAVTAVNMPKVCAGVFTSTASSTAAW